MYKQSTPTNKAFMQTQLKFNLQQPPQVNRSQHKPRPIVIEKLLPIQCSISSDENTMSSHNSVLSSERLATAMQLAKLDIKRLKSMLHQDEADKPNHQRIPTREKLAKTRTQTNNVENKKKRLNVHINLGEQEPQQQLPQPKVFRPKKRNTLPDNGSEIVTEKKDLKTFQQLQKNVEKHTKKLHQLIKNHTLEHSVPVGKSRLDQEEQTEHERRKHQAEEQIVRSARMLYVLQRKIQELRDHSDKKKYRETKKSAYLQSVSSAQRAAVRTLQMFVNAAPLYFDTSGKLPPIYTELGSLIQQLTRLSMDIPYSGFNMEDTIEDLVTSLKELENCQKSPNKANARVSSENEGKRKKSILDVHDDWLKEKADRMKLESLLEKDEQTPERKETMRHAKEAFKNLARDQQKPVKKKPSNKQQNVKQRNLRKLLTHKRKYVSVQPRKSTYDAPTVTSRIREKPPVEKSVKNTPPSTPKKNVAFEVDIRTAKERDMDIITEARRNNESKQSPSSPVVGIPRSSPRRLKTPPPPYCNDMKIASPSSSLNEREISRQYWLDRLKAKEMRKLEVMTKQNEKEYFQLRKNFDLSRHLVSQAEIEIAERLKPLLDRAEVIAQGDEKRSEDFDRSVKKRFAEIASQQALSEGERLAEYILDDLLTEAALDMSNMDSELQAEADAAFLHDLPTLERIEERLHAFEEEEQNIRRAHQSVVFSGPNLNAIDQNAELLGKENQHEHQKVIRFTKNRPVYVPQSDGQHNQARSGEDKILLDVPTGMFYNILESRDNFETYVKNSSSHSGTFDPCVLVTSFADELLDEMLYEVSGEINESCNRYVEDVYEKEFVHSKT